MTDVKPSYEDLERRLRLAESSNASLLWANRRLKAVSKSRLERLKRVTKQYQAEQAVVKKLQEEAHGG